MAYCPNCAAQLASLQEDSCWNCAAIFNTDGAWRPIDARPPNVQQMVRRNPRKVDIGSTAPVARTAGELLVDSLTKMNLSPWRRAIRQVWPKWTHQLIAITAVAFLGYLIAAAIGESSGKLGALLLVPPFILIGIPIAWCCSAALHVLVILPSIMLLRYFFPRQRRLLVVTTTVIAFVVMLVASGHWHTALFGAGLAGLSGTIHYILESREN